MADGLKMDLRIQGDEQVKKMLSGIGLDLSDLRGVMDDVGKGAVRYFSGPVFLSRGQVLGQSWPRLSSAYAKRKAKQYAGRPILVATGRMQRRFIHTPTATSVMITNTDPKFRYHQSTEPRRKIPRRAMIGLSDQLHSDIKATIIAGIAQKIKQRGGR